MLCVTQYALCHNGFTNIAVIFVYSNQLHSLRSENLTEHCWDKDHYVCMMNVQKPTNPMRLVHKVKYSMCSVHVLSFEMYGVKTHTMKT